jgi:hypothetical protein
MTARRRSHRILSSALMTPLLAGLVASAPLVMTVMPGVATAAGSSTVTITNVVDQAGLYSPTSQAAGFFDVTATNTGKSTLTHEGVLVYLPISFTPLAAFSFVGGALTPYPGCRVLDRHGHVLLPAFACGWDESWAPGFAKGPITFAVGGSTAGTFTNSIKVVLGAFARPTLAAATATISVGTGGGRATIFTGPTTTNTTIQTSGTGQQEQLVLPPSSGGYLADVGEASGSLACGAAAVAGQFGNLVSAHVNKGQSVSPYMEWTLNVVLSQQGQGGRVTEPGAVPTFNTDGLVVFHCLDNGTTLDTIAQSNSCSSGPPTAVNGCMVSLSANTVETEQTGFHNEADETYTTTIVIVFRTLTNGFIKGGGI